MFFIRITFKKSLAILNKYLSFKQTNLRSHTKTGSNFNGRKRAINKKKSGNTGSKETEKRRRTEENHEITEIPYVNQHKENENIEREWL